MLKQMVVATAVTVFTIGSGMSAQGADRWEYQGVASTGERVFLNLDSIQADQRGGGYFFVYQIGQDRPFSFTTCDGRFQVAGDDGVMFGRMMEPQSEATRRMLSRVCTYHLSQ